MYFAGKPCNIYRLRGNHHDNYMHITGSPCDTGIPRTFYGEKICSVVSDFASVWFDFDLREKLVKIKLIQLLATWIVHVSNFTKVGEKAVT